MVEIIRASGVICWNSRAMWGINELLRRVVELCRAVMQADSLLYFFLMRYVFLGKMWRCLFN